MEIIYNQNPLATTVKLDEHEREILWHKVRYAEMEDLLFSAHFHLTQEGHIDHAQAIRELDPDYYMKDDREKSGLDQRVDELMKYYLESLEDMHAGDCICFPCSCTKCHTESILGIETLKPYPGKSVLYKIDRAFTYKEGDVWKQRTLPEALEHLKSYPENLKVKNEAWKNQSQESWDACVPRWTEEAKTAYDYLFNYAKEHNML